MVWYKPWTWGERKTEVKVTQVKAPKPTGVYVVDTSKGPVTYKGPSKEISKIASSGGGGGGRTSVSGVSVSGGGEAIKAVEEIKQIERQPSPKTPEPTQQKEEFTPPKFTTDVKPSAYAKEVGSATVKPSEYSSQKEFAPWVASKERIEKESDISEAIREGEYASQVISPTARIPLIGGMTAGGFEFQQKQINELKKVFGVEREVVKERERVSAQFEKDPTSFAGATGFKETETGYTLGKEYFETLPSFQKYMGLFTEEGYLKSEVSKQSLLEAKNIFGTLPFKTRAKMYLGETGVGATKFGIGVAEFGASIFESLGVQTYEPGESIGKSTAFRFGGTLGAIMQTPTVQSSVETGKLFGLIEYPKEKPGTWFKEFVLERPATLFPIAATATLGVYGAKDFFKSSKLYGVKATALESTSYFTPFRPTGTFVYSPSKEFFTKSNQVKVKTGYVEMGDKLFLKTKGMGISEPIIFEQSQLVQKIDGNIFYGKGTTTISVPSMKYFGGELYSGVTTARFSTIPIGKGGFTGKYSFTKNYRSIEIENLVGVRGREISQMEWDVSLFKTPKGYDITRNFFPSGTTKIIYEKGVGVSLKIKKDLYSIFGGTETPTITRINKEGVSRVIKTSPNVKGYAYRIAKIDWGLEGQPTKIFKPSQITKTPFSKTFSQTNIQKVISQQVPKISGGLEGASTISPNILKTTFQPVFSLTLVEEKYSVLSGTRFRSEFGSIFADSDRVISKFGLGLSQTPKQFVGLAQSPMQKMKMIQIQQPKLKEPPFLQPPIGIPKFNIPYDKFPMFPIGFIPGFGWEKRIVKGKKGKREQFYQPGVYAIAYGIKRKRKPTGISKALFRPII